VRAQLFPRYQLFAKGRGEQVSAQRQYDDRHKIIGVLECQSFRM